MIWAEMKFIDFIQLQRGHDLTKEQFKNGPYPVVSSTSIMGYHQKYKAEAPGVVTGRSGTLGKVQYITENYWPHNTALFVKDFKGNFPRFVYYFLTDFSTDKHGGGAAVPTLNRNSLSGIIIRVPDIVTQKRIADVLSAYDDLIENNKKQIKLLEEAAIRLYKEWFVSFRFPGHETVDIVNGLPRGWTFGKTKDFMRFKYGKALKADHRKDGEYPVYGSSGVVGYHNDFLIVGPVIIVGRKGNVGSVYLSQESAFPIDTVYYIESNISIMYNYFNLKTRSFNNNDSAVPGLNRDYVEGMDMICPDKELLSKFDEKVTTIFDMITNLLRQINLLQQARDFLLPKLMNGDIEV